MRTKEYLEELVLLQLEGIRCASQILNEVAGFVASSLKVQNDKHSVEDAFKNIEASEEVMMAEAKNWINKAKHIILKQEEAKHEAQGKGV